MIIWKDGTKRSNTKREKVKNINFVIFLWISPLLLGIGIFWVDGCIGTCKIVSKKVLNRQKEKIWVTLIESMILRYMNVSKFANE